MGKTLQAVQHRINTLETKVGNFGTLQAEMSVDSDNESDFTSYHTSNPRFEIAARNMTTTRHGQKSKKRIEKDRKGSEPVLSSQLPVTEIYDMRMVQEASNKLARADIGMYFANNRKPTAREMEMYYDAFVHLMRTNGLPILTRKQLQRRGSTHPVDHGLTMEQFDIINAAILQKLLTTIPADTPVIRDIIASHASEQDGYGALYSCMRHFCAHLQDLRRCWGPEWEYGDTAYSYGAALKSYLDTEESSGRKFSRREIAAEILQQAMRHGRYRITATIYLQQLTSSLNDHDLGEEFNATRLLMTVEQNKNTAAESPKKNKPSSSNLHVAKTQVNKRFQYRRQVQCRVCRTFGHDTDEDICRIGAQVQHILNFQTQDPGAMDKNATAYNLANNRSTIKMVCKEVEPDEQQVMEAEQLALELVSNGQA